MSTSNLDGLVFHSMEEIAMAETLAMAKERVNWKTTEPPPEQHPNCRGGFSEACRGEDLAVQFSRNRRNVQGGLPRE
jgi:hypothetical protein